MVRSCFLYYGKKNKHLEAEDRAGRAVDSCDANTFRSAYFDHKAGKTRWLCVFAEIRSSLGKIDAHEGISRQKRPLASTVLDCELTALLSKAHS